jgi:hypothetical protein
MSMTLYEAVGKKNLDRFFVDGTHQSDYGAYELCKCVVNGIVENKLPWAQYLVSDWKPFDPAHPDDIDAFDLPPDQQLDPARPGGPGSPAGLGPMAGAPVRARGATSRAATQQGAR